MRENRIEPWISGVVHGELRDLGFYPALIQGEERVHGELHQYRHITDILWQLDRIEGHKNVGDPNNLYERILIDVMTDTGIIQAWTYRMREKTGVHIESGDWKSR